MSLQSLSIKSKQLIVSQDIIDKTENARQLFVSKFPLNKIKDLSIDQYVQGTDENSFCYWLEFKKVLFGIGGGNASKFGVYKAKDGNYYTSYGANKKQLHGEELDKFFNNVKSGIIQALSYTEKNEIHKIKSIDLPLWNMVVQKIISIYYPDKFLTIGSPDVLIECARDILVKKIELEQENSIQINFECKNLLSGLPEYKDWSYVKIGQFIWESYLDDSKRDYYILGSKYGGKNDRDIFPDMINKNAVAIGFASNIDLSDYYCSSQSEITEYLKEKGEESNSYNALKYFLNLRVGDRIAVKADGSPKGKNGFLSIIGIAEVVERDGLIYEHDPNGLGHLINVKFITAPTYKEFDLGGYGRTIHKLSNPDHIDLIFKNKYTINETSSKIKDYRLEFTNWLIKKYGENSGTNSSYLNAIDVLSQILSKELFKISDINFINELYQDLIKEQKKSNSKYYNAATPSYGSKGFYSASINQYLQFLNSLKSNKSSMKDFKNDIAINSILYGPPGTGKTYRLQKEYFDKFTIKETALSKEQYLESLIADLSWWQTICIAVLDLGSAKVNEIHDHEFIRIKEKLSSSKTIRPTIWGQLQSHTVLDCPNVNVTARMEPLFFYKSTETKWTVDNELLEQYYPEAFEILEKSKNFVPDTNKSIKNYEFITFHQSFSYEDFIEGIKPKLDESEKDVSFEIKDGVFKKLCQKAEADPTNSYAIFIDEINRGNVSAIFGELITLIEDDKRIGGSNEIRVRLPYSKSEFGVPSNLFIIGTMNTADRSVEALDTALRRRFSFTEIMPDPSLLTKIEYKGYNLAEVLTTINERIEVLLDRDHTIGHSYFLKLESGDDKGLASVFANNIIPLLQEYFYHDYEKVALILGEGFVKIKENKAVKFANFKNIDAPELANQFELITEVDNIENAIRLLLKN